MKCLTILFHPLDMSFKSNLAVEEKDILNKFKAFINCVPAC